MKKHTALTLALLIALVGLAACSEKKENQAENKTSLPYVEADIEEPSQNLDSTSKTVTFIGEEKAKELAAARAGFAVATLEFKEFELDEDDNIWKYEMEFRYNNILYEAEINAQNGEVVKWEESKIE